ncbi:MAG: tetratricopeptide repeat protein [Balneola sp.]|jgi:TolB-like protein/Tfp pilus assembly protein PilF
MNISKLIAELKRRNVFRVVTAYAIAGWLIIQICATTFPYLNFPDWIITAVIIVVIVGFPFAPIFAWVFEFTSDGIKKSDDVDITDSVTANTGRKLNIIIISTLSLALIFVLVERVFFAKSAFIEEMELGEFQEASIAIIPFSDLSPQGDQEYFSDGLSEEMLNRLAKIEDIKVAGRMSSYKFKGQEDNLEGITQELKVAHVLEGSVRKSGSQIRITAKLIDARNGFNLWSESYDRELTAENIFQIQEDISKRVLQELKVRLLPEEVALFEARPTKDIEAYNLYLAATQLEHNRKASELEEAVEKYKQAIVLDPTFAEAYARIAFAYALLHEYGNLPQSELIPLMRENIDQALLLDGNLGRAYHSLAYLYRYTGEYEKALTASERAIELMPNDSRAYTAYRNSLFFNRRYDEIGSAMKKAYEIDPLDPGTANMYARGLSSDGEYEQAIEIFDSIIRNYPDFGPAYGEKARIFRDVPYGEIDKAFEMVYESYQRNPDDLNLMIELVNISHDVEFMSFAKHLINKMDEMYPKNGNALRPKINHLFILEDYSEIEKVYNELINDIGDDMIGNLIRIKGQLLGLQESYVELENHLKETYPTLFEEQVQLDDLPFGPVNAYQVLLMETGRTERANYIGVAICEEISSRIEEMGEEISRVMQLEAQLGCAIAERDKDAIIDSIEKLYFEMNSKANWPDAFATVATYRSYKDDPKFRSLKNRICDDLDLMKTKMKEYLKAEGEWKEEWDEN